MENFKYINIIMQNNSCACTDMKCENHEEMAGPFYAF